MDEFDVEKIDMTGDSNGKKSSKAKSKALPKFEDGAEINWINGGGLIGKKGKVDYSNSKFLGKGKNQDGKGFIYGILYEGSEEVQLVPERELELFEEFEASKKSKMVMENVKKHDPILEKCEQMLKERNRKKREEAGPRRKKTRYTKLKNYLLAIQKLTPPKYKDDLKVNEETSSILKNTAKELMPLWEMDRIEQVENALDDRLDDIQDEIQEQDQKENINKWKGDLPRTENIIAYEKKHNKHLLEEAALEIVDKIGQAIKIYAKDKKKAFDFLNKKFDKGQLKEYLPEFIYTEMKSSLKAK